MTTQRNVRQILMILLLAIMPMILSACSTPAQASPTTLTGIVTDVHCYLKKPDITLDTKQCLQMPACAATGYGVVVTQDDGTSQFYFLDGDFAPAATGSQQTAASLIDASEKHDHFYFSVTGVISDDKKTIAYDKSYPVITVTSMSETDGE